MKIITGGQTGVDQIALDSASLAGLRTGGWAPRGFITAEGKAQFLQKRYGLQELQRGGSLASQYVARSCRNVDDAQATLAFLLYYSMGTSKTVGYAVSGKWTPLGALEVDRREAAPGLVVLDEATCGRRPHRPCIVVKDVQVPLTGQRRAATLSFLQRHSVETLNICGHRLSARLEAELGGVASFMRELTELISSNCGGE